MLFDVLITALFQCKMWFENALSSCNTDCENIFFLFGTICTLAFTFLTHVLICLDKFLGACSFC